MDKNTLDKMRRYYHSLLGIKRMFEGASGGRISYASASPLMEELRCLDADFPGLLSPRYGLESFFKKSSANDEYLDRFAIESLLTVALGKLQVATEEPSNTPVTERRQFTFINSTQLKEIIERDYLEIQKAYISECYKSVIILCGSAIEAILIDLLLANESNAKTAKSAPRKNDITRWDLSALIRVAVELELVTEGIEKLSSPIREYRNLVHPGNELRNKVEFGAEEARIAVEVLNIVHRDLSK